MVQISKRQPEFREEREQVFQHRCTSERKLFARWQEFAQRLKATVDEKVVLRIRPARKDVVRTHRLLRREIDDDDAVLQLFTRFAVELLKTGAQKIERPLE